MSDDADGRTVAWRSGVNDDHSIAWLLLSADTTQSYFKHNAIIMRYRREVVNSAQS